MRRAVSTVSAFAHREGVGRTRGHSFVKDAEVVPGPASRQETRVREAKIPSEAKLSRKGEVLRRMFGDE
jgi:hypothetical protein